MTLKKDYALPVGELKVWVRIARAFREEGIVTLGDLAQRTEEYLLRLPGIGPSGLQKIKVTLRPMNIELGEVKPNVEWDPRTSGRAR